jgi:hypothetical protein
MLNFCAFPCGQHSASSQFTVDVVRILFLLFCVELCPINNRFLFYSKKQQILTDWSSENTEQSKIQFYAFREIVADGVC